MTTALSPILVSRLEKAATDNGFDQIFEPEADWLVVASTQCPLRVWLMAFGEAPLFQYIVTTTSRPPDELVGDDRVRLKLKGSPAEARLLGRDL